MDTRRLKRGSTREVLSVQQIHHDQAVQKAGGIKRPNESLSQEILPRSKRAVLGDVTNAFKKSDMGKKGSKIPHKKTTKVTLNPGDSSWEVIDSSQGSPSSKSSQESNRSSDSEIELKNWKNTLETTSSPEVTVEEICEKLNYVDIDAENANDPFQCPLYACDIFQYYKEREEKFQVDDYMSRQPSLSPNMRAILVDWMVEVQENFELNHETLYLGVKLVDQYLNKQAVQRENLQLVGSTALFIACKFDERCPPLIDDFLYICDDAYTRHQLTKMEITVIKEINFDLGIPLSYRFLRRYAKCAKASMETLTLGRYILELSLMEYGFTQQLDSKIAAAALLLAFKMKRSGEWDSQLVHYTGYELEDVEPFVLELNAMLTTPPSKNLMTIRSKYSHQVFFEVAKTPVLDILELS